MDNLNPLPEIKVIPLTASNRESVSPQRRRSRIARIQTALADIRSGKVQEFLNSSNLAANTRKVYERELKRFLSWTELLQAVNYPLTRQAVRETTTAATDRSVQPL